MAQRRHRRHFAAHRATDEMKQCNAKPRARRHSFRPPLPGDTPHLMPAAHVFLNPRAQTRANALCSEATQIRTAQRRRRRHFATQSATDYRYDNATRSLAGAVAPRPPQTAWHRHHKRDFATRCATDSTHSSAKPAPQRHAAFTPACFPSPSGADSCKRIWH